jgi:hypothetical protein
VRDTRIVGGNRGFKPGLQRQYRLGAVFIASPKNPSIEDAAVTGNSGCIYYLNECGDDLAPTEGWSDRSQNCLNDVRIVGKT